MNKVKVYDFDSKQLTEIPAEELAPGMIHVTIQGLGAAYVEASKLKASTQRHPLPERFAEIALAVREEIKAYATWIKTDAEWLDGFSKDQHPARELARWMRLAAALHLATDGGRDPVEVRKEMFAVLVATLGNGQNALETVQLHQLSRLQAQSIVDALLEQSTEEFVSFWETRIDFDRFIALKKNENERA